MADSRAFQFKNFSRSTLAAAIGPADTTVTLQTGHGLRFPSPDPTYDEIFALVITDSQGNFEVMYCTERVLDSLTVERAKEDTTARTWAADTDIVHTVTKGFWEQLIENPTVAPTAPVLSSEVTGTYDDEVALSWTESTPDDNRTIVEYLVYRQVDGGGYTLVATIAAADPLEYTDTELDPGEYDYYVIAVDDLDQESDPSNTESETIEAPAEPEWIIALQDAENGGISTYSVDGATWTQAGSWSGFADHKWGIAFAPGLGSGDGRWLACGGGSTGDTIYSDDDGFTWTVQYTGSAENFEGLAYGLGYFFAGTNNNSIYRSATGLSASWTQVLTKRGYDVQYIADFETPMIIGAGNDDAGPAEIFYTTDGTTWADASVDGIETPDGVCVAIAYDASRDTWWTCHKNTTTIKIYSTDDIFEGTWTERHTAGTQGSQLSGYRFAIQPNGAIVLSGGVTWTSFDNGDNWSAELGAGTNGVIWSRYLEMFIAVGTDIYTSPDGDTWTTRDDDNPTEVVTWGSIGMRTLDEPYVPPTDPDFADVFVLMGFNDGADGVSGNGIWVDDSSSAHTFGGAVSPASPQVDTAQAKFGGKSALYFSFTNTVALSINGTANVGLSNTDFTLETWVRFSDVGNLPQCFLAQYSLTDGQRAWWLRLNSSSQLEFAYNTTGFDSSNVAVVGAWTPSIDTWYHIAVARDGANLRLFVDGVQVGSTHNISTTTISNSNVAWAIGAFFGGSAIAAQHFRGWMDELRITKGSCRYTANFTVPNQAFPRS